MTRNMLTIVFVAIVALGAAPVEAQQKKATDLPVSRCTPATGSDKWTPLLVYFDTGSAKIRAEDQKKIADNAKLAKQQYVQQICIKGVTDKQGDAKANERLAMQRAQAVAAEYMKLGMTRDMLVLEAAGEPGAGFLSGWQRQAQADRRVEIKWAR